MRLKLLLPNVVLLTVALLTGCASQSTPEPQKPTGINAIEAAKTRVSLGLTYLKNGNYIQAKANLDKALEFAPRYSDAHFGLAHYYQQVSEMELARQYFEQALQLNKSNPDLINSYGAFLCEIGEYDAATENLLKAAKSKSYSRSAETYENLAICSHRQGNVDDALTYLRSALQHQPGRARSWYMFVELLIGNEQWQEAKVAYRQYEKVVPVTADTLNLAIEIEEGLGNKKVAAGYADMLKALYPDQVGQSRKVILRPVPKQSMVPVETIAATNTISTSPAENQDNSRIDAQERQEVLYHVLQKGETLYQISRRYNVKVQSLVAWNSIDDVSNLSIGQKLTVSQP